MDEEERKRKMDDGVAGIFYFFKIFVDFCQVVGGAALSLGPRTIQ